PCSFFFSLLGHDGASRVTCSCIFQSSREHWDLHRYPHLFSHHSPGTVTPPTLPKPSILPHQGNNAPSPIPPKQKNAETSYPCMTHTILLDTNNNPANDSF